MKTPQTENLLSELVFTTSRSSGPGGQNVNKVNSKVTLKFDVINSSKLSEEEKELIMKKLATKITKDGILVLTSQDKRSQLQNKEEVLLRLDQLLVKAFTPKKSRKATKPTRPPGKIGSTRKSNGPKRNNGVRNFKGVFRINRTLSPLKVNPMTKFIELQVSEELEMKKELVNIANIGRVYPSPQSSAKSIVELNYQSVNDTPVYLEVDMAYETLRLKFLGQ